MIYLFFSVGLMVGFLGALLGVGGGVFLVPILTLLFKVPIKEAIGTSLLIVIATSTAASGINLRSGLVDKRLAFPLLLFLTMGAVGGGLLAGVMKPEGLSILFGLVLAYTAASMGTAKKDKESIQADELKSYEPKRWPLGLSTSILAGGTSGLLGIGGGAVQVPIMYLIMGIPLKISVATSNFMVGITAAASVFIYYSRGDIDLLVTGPTAVGTFAGSLLGATLLPKVRSVYLRWLFGIVLFYLGSRMVLQGLHLSFSSLF